MSTTAIWVAIFTCTGFWTGLFQFLTNVYNKKRTKQDATTRMILGIANKIICESCQEYIARGDITTEEYEDLKKYLCEPYFELGGNGTVERLFKEVDQLPIKVLY